MPRIVVIMAPKGKKAARTLKTDTMPKEEVSKMLSMLKYNSSEKFKGDEVVRAQSAAALAHYRNLDTASKPAFLKKFNANKRDLSWVMQSTGVLDS